jgi:hypothetical protein
MDFKDTRLQLHHALQAAAGIGRTLLPKKSDDSHTSFSWSDAHGALVQECVDGKFRSGLRLCDMTLLLIRADGSVEASLPMNGRMLEDGYRFFEEKAGAMLERPGEGLPAHGVAGGASFMPVGDHLESLGSMYATAARLLHELCARTPGAGPVRCWPHHFDIATTIALGGDAIIGVGFVPGDEGIPEPYWYVYRYPTASSALSSLPAGEWYHGTWSGALLKLPADDATVATFLDAAVAALR